MKGVLLAGGTGSRLAPMTRFMNKHLMSVGEEPMILHPLRRLSECGCREILVVTGTEHAGGVFQFLGSGSEWRSRLTFRVQDKPGGIAEALLLAEDFAGTGPFAVLLADNIFEHPITPWARDFEASLGPDAWHAAGMVLFAEVDNPGDFGVARFAMEGETEGESQVDRLVEIIEKPIEPPSNLAQTGAYFYTGNEIWGLLRSLKPSGRGELEITDLNNELLRRGALQHRKVQGWWTDAGKWDSWRRANRLVGGS